MRFKVGDTVRINDPQETYHGEEGVIVQVDRYGPFTYEVFMADGLFWFLAEQVEAATPQAQPEPQPARDFDRGFGIGGLSRHPEDEGLDELIASGQLRPREPTGRNMPHGQLWEPCSRRGCNAEPVCLDCGYCERHCTC